MDRGSARRRRQSAACDTKTCGSGLPNSARAKTLRSETCKVVETKVSSGVANAGTRGKSSRPLPGKISFGRPTEPSRTHLERAGRSVRARIGASVGARRGTSRCERRSDGEFGTDERRRRRSRGRGHVELRACRRRAATPCEVRTHARGGTCTRAPRTAATEDGEWSVVRDEQGEERTCVTSHLRGIVPATTPSRDEARSRWGFSGVSRPSGLARVSGDGL